MPDIRKSMHGRMMRPEMRLGRRCHNIDLRLGRRCYNLDMILGRRCHNLDLRLGRRCFNLDLRLGRHCHNLDTRLGRCCYNLDMKLGRRCHNLDIYQTIFYLPILKLNNDLWNKVLFIFILQMKKMSQVEHWGNNSSYLILLSFSSFKPTLTLSYL